MGVRKEYTDREARDRAGQQPQINGPLLLLVFRAFCKALWRAGTLVGLRIMVRTQR